MEELEKKIQKILDELRDLEPEIFRITQDEGEVFDHYNGSVREVHSFLGLIRWNINESEAPESILSDSNPEPILRPMLEPKKALEAKIEAAKNSHMVDLDEIKIIYPRIKKKEEE